MSVVSPAAAPTNPTSRSNPPDGAPPARQSDQQIQSPDEAPHRPASPTGRSNPPDGAPTSPTSPTGNDYVYLFDRL